MEIGFQLFLRSKGGRVDACQHRVVAVPTPIGAGHFHQLESITDFARRGHMRATAEIEPIALTVDF